MTDTFYGPAPEKRLTDVIELAKAFRKRWAVGISRSLYSIGPFDMIRDLLSYSGPNIHSERGLNHISDIIKTGIFPYFAKRVQSIVAASELDGIVPNEDDHRLVVWVLFSTWNTDMRYRENNVRIPGDWPDGIIPPHDSRYADQSEDAMLDAALAAERDKALKLANSAFWRMEADGELTRDQMDRQRNVMMDDYREGRWPHMPGKRPSTYPTRRMTDTEAEQVYVDDDGYSHLLGGYVRPKVSPGSRGARGSDRGAEDRR